MSPTDLAVQEQQAQKGRQRVINDFSIQVATVNGSGSQTANLVLLRSILLMGVPVSGKNMFPSNIAGLPRPVRNMIYDGILPKLLGLDMGLMEKALNKQLGKKGKAVVLNQGALKAGWDYAEANFTKQDPFVIERMNETAGKILVEGNTAAAIGCMMAGVTVVAWYPITPSSSLCESLISYMKTYR